MINICLIHSLKHNLNNCHKQSLKSLLILLACGQFVTGCSEEPDQKHSPLKLLADDNGQFASPSMTNKIIFPQAHAPQKAYRQEWWYLTTTLTTEDGQSLASQWTLFRRAVGDKHWYFAHAALADAQSHNTAYRNGREELGNVNITTEPFNATIDDWQWQSSSNLLPANLVYGSAVGSIASETDSLIKENTVVAAAENHWQVELNLSTKQDYFLQGENGFSLKHPKLNIASHYYSQPFIEVTGKVYWQGKWQKVTGQAWFDREWASKMLGQDQQGWDWFSLRLNENTALMVFRVRSDSEDYFYASIMARDGEIRSIASHEINLISHNNNATSDSPYPQSFSLVIAKENIDIKVEVLNEQQIMRFGIEYFEGMVNFSGSHQGEGFVEMTGYSDN
ncbi:lipocalin-like domain-containing protein [Colwellia psychrerythraea]|uniref:Hydroxyneurosporene synthase n=1 Tax=Colwellia psychrerythraea TaxID=28229 RepID=A0A099L3B1_COLPS|nr:lipocalin-like domain-containing protein [Colwellia psychrerythraea]KGJ97351.1 hydroxyneurosporene synthase [Colwellia psychrerythraea]